MKTLKISDSTHLKIKALQLYFNTKTISETLEKMIQDTADHEFEYDKLGMDLLRKLTNNKELQFDDK